MRHLVTRGGAVYLMVAALGVLTLASAAITTTWIETEERRIEREILHDLHRRLGLLHDEIKALRMDPRAAASSATAARPAPEQPPDPG